MGSVFNTKGYRIWKAETDQIVETISASFREVPQSVAERSGVVMVSESCDPFSIDSVDNQGEGAVEIDSWSPLNPPGTPPDARIGGEGLRNPSPNPILKILQPLLPLNEMLGGYLSQLKDLSETELIYFILKRGKLKE